ncbi:hypothetical protein C8R45DRAFT_824375, partial [Mycena sanguinolenta]
SIVLFFPVSLSTHPCVCKRLREEMLMHVGSARRLTYDDIRDMKFWRAASHIFFLHSQLR